MDEQVACAGIRVRRSHVRLILDQASTIQKLFGVRIFQPSKWERDGSESTVRLAIETDPMGTEQLANVTADVQVCLHNR